VPDWPAVTQRLEARYADGAARLPVDPERRQRQLVRLANAAAAAGLAALMEGRGAAARDWLLRAARHYRESYAGAPAESWGRPLGAVKSRLVAGDAEGAADDARWALSLGAAQAPTPIGRYAATLAFLVLGDDAAAVPEAERLGQIREEFPASVADALLALATRDRGAYAEAIAGVVGSFEARTQFLEDVPVADTVLALEALAASRGMAVRPVSPLLP
jgi:hypothetical protein